MDEKERAVDAATQAVVEYIKDDMQQNPVFDALVDTLIQQNPDAHVVQQMYLESSAGDATHLAIEGVYSKIWEAIERAAMKYIIAKLMMEYYG